MSDRTRRNGSRHSRTEQEVEQARAFGAWLLARIEERNLSQRRFAQEAGLGMTTVQEYVSGAFIPKPASVVLLAKALVLPESVVFHAAGIRPPGESEAREDSPDRGHLRRLVDGIREERVPYPVRILEAFIAADEAGPGGQSTQRTVASPEPGK